MAFQINHPAGAAMLAVLALVAAPDESRAQCPNGRQGQKNVLMQQRGLQPQNALQQQLQQLQQQSLLQSALQRQTQQNSFLIALYTKQQNALTSQALATTVALDSQQFQIAVQAAMQQTQLAAEPVEATICHGHPKCLAEFLAKPIVVADKYQPGL